MRNLIRCSLAVAAVVSLFAAMAVAQDGERARPDRACALECRQDNRLCMEAVRTDLGLCRETCAEPVAAARELCAADPESQECADARAAAAACLQPCRGPVNEAVRACHEDVRACIVACPVAEPTPPPGAACVLGCRDGHRTCQTEVDAALRACTAECDELAAAARAACAETPRAQECQDARRAAVACLAPCRDEANAGRRDCLRAASACTASCVGSAAPVAGGRQRHQVKPQHGQPY
jgi:hypothetical protein